MLRRKDQSNPQQKEIQDLVNQIKDEQKYLDKLQKKFITNKDNWFKFGRNSSSKYWLYMSGKIESIRDDNDYKNHGLHCRDNRHFLLDPVVAEIRHTQCSIRHKEELLRLLKSGKPIDSDQLLGDQDEDDEEYDD